MSLKKNICLLFSSVFCLQFASSQEYKKNKYPMLGEETLSSPEEEAKLNKLLVDIIKGTVQKGYEFRTGQDHAAKRDAHAKQHGCVAAKFKIESQIPARFRKGIFSTKGEYKAILRFSNGSGEIRSDKISDAHGLAIKVLGIKANLLTSEEANGEIKTQDFVMIDHPVFFLRKSQDYIPFMQAQKNGPEGFKEWLKNNPYEAKIINDTLSKNPLNPLSVQYWSQTSYKIGERNAMKYTAKPCAEQNFIEISKENRSESYLKEALSMQLANSDSCYEFFIIPQRDSKLHPIEDPTVEWPSVWKGKSNIIKMATINILKGQRPGSAEALKICEELSFTPWHGSEELRPLGSVNRTRKSVYLEISKFRNQLNNVNYEVPTDDTWEILAEK